MRRYSEEEFALILRKASEIQASGGSQPAGAGTGGLTLEEIRSIATEAGIDPEAVTRAASILGALGWKEKGGLAAAIFGGPSKFYLDCEIPGRLPPEEMGRILEQIRRAAKHQGEASEVLGGVEWKTVGELSAINVNISPRGDSTSIQIVGDLSGAGAFTFTFSMVVAAVLVGVFFLNLFWAFFQLCFASSSVAISYYSVQSGTIKSGPAPITLVPVLSAQFSPLSL